MNLRLAQDIHDEKLGIREQMKELFAEQFKGLAPETHFMDDLTYQRWYHQQMQTRPNFEQLLCVAEGGKDEIRRFWRSMGAPEIADIVIATYGGMSDGPA